MHSTICKSKNNHSVIHVVKLKQISILFCLLNSDLHIFQLNNYTVYCRVVAIWLSGNVLFSISTMLLYVCLS